MELNLNLPTKAEILNSVKNVRLNDLDRVFYRISALKGIDIRFSYSTKVENRKYYIEEAGNKVSFDNKRDCYIHLISTYGEL